MSPRAVILAITAVVVGIGGLVRYREPVLLKLGLESWEPEYYRALDLAKSARTLLRYHTNYFTIQHRMKLEGGAIDPEGWKATRSDDSRFLVTYRSTIGTRPVEYDFVVDIGVREVFVQRDDPERPDVETDDTYEPGLTTQPPSAPTPAGPPGPPR